MFKKRKELHAAAWRAVYAVLIAVQKHYMLGELPELTEFGKRLKDRKIIP